MFDFLTRTSTHHAPISEGGGHGGGDTSLARSFIKAVTDNNQSVLGVTPEDVLNSHLLVFAAEKARQTHSVVDFDGFKGKCFEGSITM